MASPVLCGAVPLARVNAAAVERSQEEYLAEMRGRWAVLSKAEEKQETDTSSTSTASNASKSSASRSPESTECGHLAAALEHLDLRA
jgi:hypothetical protein